jgi:hypothetical protein
MRGPSHAALSRGSTAAVHYLAYHEDDDTRGAGSQESADLSVDVVRVEGDDGEYPGEQSKRNAPP